MKILIGCPTSERYGYCLNLWIKRVGEIIEHSKGHEVDYLLVDNSKNDDFFKELKKTGIHIIKAPFLEDVRERIVNSRNILVEKAIKEGYDYFLSLEQDIIPPVDIIEKLLVDKKIISAYYGKPAELRVQDRETGEIKDITIEMPVIYIQEANGVRRANPNEVFNKGIIKVGGFGLGCLLINRKVLEKVKFRFEKNAAAFDDLIFCHDAKKLGYELFLNSNVRVEHLHRVWE